MQEMADWLAPVVTGISASRINVSPELMNTHMPLASALIEYDYWSSGVEPIPQYQDVARLWASIIAAIEDTLVEMTSNESNRELFRSASAAVIRGITIPRQLVRGSDKLKHAIGNHVYHNFLVAILTVAIRKSQNEAAAHVGADLSSVISALERIHLNAPPSEYFLRLRDQLNVFIDVFSNTLDYHSFRLGNAADPNSSIPTFVRLVMTGLLLINSLPDCPQHFLSFGNDLLRVLSGATATNRSDFVTLASAYVDAFGDGMRSLAPEFANPAMP